MIKRELYMNRIRPFIGGELIKVMTGIRRSGKSVMLELIKEELAEAGVAPSQMISIIFWLMWKKECIVPVPVSVWNS